MKEKKTMQEMNEQFKDCPVQQNEYVIDGVKYRVKSHFTGTKNLKTTLYQYAFNKALAEMMFSVPQMVEK